MKSYLNNCVCCHARSPSPPLMTAVSHISVLPASWSVSSCTPGCGRRQATPPHNCHTTRPVAYTRDPANRETWPTVRPVPARSTFQDTEAAPSFSLKIGVNQQIIYQSNILTTWPGKPCSSLPPLSYDMK